MQSISLVMVVRYFSTPPAMLDRDCLSSHEPAAAQALAFGGVFVVNLFNDEPGTPARRRVAAFGLTVRVKLASSRAIHMTS